MLGKELKRLIDPNGKCCCEHALASNCKKWALGLTPSWKVTSGLHLDKAFAQIEFRLNESECELRHYYADIEPSAVFKACEWVLQQTKKKHI